MVRVESESPSSREACMMVTIHRAKNATNGIHRVRLLHAMCFRTALVGSSCTCSRRYGMGNNIVLTCCSLLTGSWKNAFFSEHPCECSPECLCMVLDDCFTRIGALVMSREISVPIATPARYSCRTSTKTRKHASCLMVCRGDFRGQPRLLECDVIWGGCFHWMTSWMARWHPQGEV